MIRGVIFDMDGVLIEAKDWHYEALNRGSRSQGCVDDRDEHEARGPPGVHRVRF